MELRPGYKRTEVGVIPEDWDAKSLGDVAEVVMGQSPVGTSYNRNGIGAALINGPTEFTDEHPIRIQWTSQPTKFSKRGDVLLCVRGSSTGRINISDDEYCIGRGVAAIRAKPETDVSFLAFQTDSAVNGILALTTGSTFPNVDGKSIRSVKLPFPTTLLEQTTIAAALGDVDALIRALDRLITKKRDLKQAAMQQLLTGKTRLRGFGEIDIGLKQTTLGVIPNDWNLVKLNDCLACAPEYGINAPAVPLSEKLPTYIRITDITEDGRFSRENRVSVKSTDSAKYYLNEGELVFARTGASVGKSYSYNPEDGTLVFAGYLIRTRPNPSRLVADYLAAYVTTGPYWNWVHLMSMRSGQPGINGNEYRQLPILLPPTIEEQRAIATTLSEMEAEIVALEQRRDKTSDLKKGMMQELLTGRTRLI